ncbi:MAG: class I SAM-dependent methyltransferase [Melioribacteraceae bacterium]
MKNEMENPWLQIPLEDYEGHMSASNVQQLQMLDEVFEVVLNELSPKSLCVLGSTAGNGFQHLIQRNFDRVVGIDINFKYVTECRAWFIQDVPNLQLICADLNEIELTDSIFDLVHAALIFEYVDVEKLLSKIYKWLKPGGILSAVLQLPSESLSAVSKTQFISVKILEPFIKLVEPDEFRKKAEKLGLICEEETEIKLSTGKRFVKAYFKK